MNRNNPIVYIATVAVALGLMILTMAPSGGGSSGSTTGQTAPQVQATVNTSSNLVWGNLFFTKTNIFSGNVFALGTNKTYVGSSAINLSSIIGALAGNYSEGELSVIASGGSITITNPVSWNTNLTWTVSDGHRAECAMKVQLGVFTNFVVYIQ